MTRIIWLAALAACGGGDTGIGGSPGDFGQIEAAPECGALSQACIGQGLDAPIAKRSTLDLVVAYKVAGSSGPPTTLASADERVLAPTGATQLAALEAGMSAVLFVGPNGDVIDIVHVFVQAATELRLNRYDEAGDLLGRIQPMSQLVVGDEILVAVEPFANGQPLLGNFALAHTSTAPAIATILPDPVGGWYRVLARAPGHAILGFGALGLDVSWKVEVLP